MILFPNVRATLVRNTLLTVIAVAVGAMAVLEPATGEPIAGSAGVDTSLPATDSAMTLNGRGAFADLEITLNQTRNLANQAISVTWTGGKPTNRTRSWSDNYLQIMQCWGDDDGSIAENPGPPPEQCVFGATAGAPGKNTSGLDAENSFAMHRIVSRKTWPDVFDPSEGTLDSVGYVWKPFVAVDGTTVGQHADFSCLDDAKSCSFWLNPKFDITTTNEVAAAPTYRTGKGTALFEVATGIESSGLGCGRLLAPAGGGSPRAPRCWLVVVPRGDKEVENAGIPNAASESQILTSPLSKHAWANRVAFPLEFNPVDPTCDISTESRQIAGSELAVTAVSNWQPTLCTLPGARPYTYSAISEERARRRLLSPPSGSPPEMAVVLRPIAPSLIEADNPVVYAPLSLSAVVIGFNVERNPPGGVPPEEEELRGVSVEKINLTPRLVAKLLTQSYSAQVNIHNSKPYTWAETNHQSLGEDPDFLQFNPEFSYFSSSNRRNFSGLSMPSGNADHARRVWEYVLADPEARAWLDGAADPWGMRVNPVYATTASANATGSAFGDPTPDSFPKSDPYCYQGDPIPQGGRVGQPLLTPLPFCGTDWMPYAQGLRDAARQTRAAFDGAKVEVNSTPQTIEQYYRKGTPQTRGSRRFLSVTDSASAYQYGIQAARLSRAGDNGPDRTFIAPDTAGMNMAVRAMVPREEPAVLEPDPMAKGAYPLTTLTYAAVAPLSLGEQERDEYADFIEYATGPGQEPGQALGQLPRGYTPLPGPLRVQAAFASYAIRNLVLLPIDDEPAPDQATPQAAPAVAPAATVTTPPRPSALFADDEPFEGGEDTTEPATTTPSVPLAAAPVALTGSPAGTGQAAGLVTPILALAKSRFALPGLAAIALLAALVALQLSKRPRGAIGTSEPSVEGGVNP